MAMKIDVEWVDADVEEEVAVADVSIPIAKTITMEIFVHDAAITTKRVAEILALDAAITTKMVAEIFVLDAVITTKREAEIFVLDAAITTKRVAEILALDAAKMMKKVATMVKRSARFTSLKKPRRMSFLARLFPLELTLTSLKAVKLE
jgi:hypothetical protein